MNDYKKIVESIYFQRCLSVWKSIANETQIICAINYMCLAAYALEKELNISSKESENFRIRFACHLLTDEDLPVISETAIKGLV